MNTFVLFALAFCRIDWNWRWCVQPDIEPMCPNGQGTHYGTHLPHGSPLRRGICIYDTLWQPLQMAKRWFIFYSSKCLPHPYSFQVYIQYGFPWNKNGPARLECYCSAYAMSVVHSKCPSIPINGYWSKIRIYLKFIAAILEMHKLDVEFQF